MASAPSPRSGPRDYSMRVWLDPDRACTPLGSPRGMSSRPCKDRTSRFASGGAQPGRRLPSCAPFQIAVRTLGRLVDPKTSSPDIVVKAELDRRSFASRTWGRNRARPPSTTRPIPTAISTLRLRSPFINLPGSNRAGELPRRSNRQWMSSRRNFRAGPRIHESSITPTEFIQQSHRPAVIEDHRRGRSFLGRLVVHPVFCRHGPCPPSFRFVGDTCIADRHFFLHGASLGFLAQQSVAVRSGSRHRDRGRRRDRRGGEMSSANIAAGLAPA